MTQLPDDYDTVDQTSNTLRTLVSRIDTLTKEVKATNDRLEKETEKWNERFYQQSRDYGQTSRTIIITAGSVIIFSPVLSALTPAIAEFARRSLGLTG